VVVNAGSIADAAQRLIEAVPESVSVQDARPSSRRRMAAANVRTGARSVGSYGRGENCRCCRLPLLSLPLLPLLPLPLPLALALRCVALRCFDSSIVFQEIL
jgi:hypothetical protein